MASAKTCDPVNQFVIGIKDEHGVARLGIHANTSWHKDPRHLVFNLSRYKFVAKLLSGYAKVLEVGCGDSFGSKLVVQEVGSLLATDIDPLFIEDARERFDKNWPYELRVHDMLAGPIDGAFDAVYSLDVLEHIDAKDEHRFITNILKSLQEEGVLIIGMPSLESQVHSEPVGTKGHINCKTGSDFKSLFKKYFANVFLFSMNDEVVHTGFHKMAHYLFVVCCGKLK